VTPSPAQLSPSPAYNNTGRWVIYVDCFGDLPRYIVTTRYGRREKYQVFFQQLHELADGRINGRSQVSLPSLRWSWTQPKLINNQYVFSLKGTGGRRSRLQFDSIEFNHTIQATSDFLNIKFDVDIDDYDWVTSASYKRSLRLVYSLSDLLRNNDNVILNGTTGYLNRLYVGVGPTQTQADITTGSTTYKTNVSVSAYENKVRLTYSGFNSANHFDRLFHDPVIGVDSPLTDDDIPDSLAYQNETMQLILPPPSSGSKSTSYQRYAIYGGLAAGSCACVVAMIVAAVMWVRSTPRRRTQIDLPSTEDY